MVKENILKVKERIQALCSEKKIDPTSITIIAVSKGRSIEQIKEAVAAGITDIAENRVQEATLKYNQLTTHNSQLTTIKWHLVGHLQTNKAREAVRIFDLIHSVDSLRMAAEIDRQAARLNKVQDILIQVKTSPETAKFGAEPRQTRELIEEIAKLKNINTKGLMTIAPLVDNPEATRPYFRMLRLLRDRVNELRARNDELQILSMGMSDDFAVAIEEGATMLRLGRAIFKDTD